MAKPKLVATNEIKIDKGVPMPSPASAPGRSSKWPWNGLAVGDSFFMPNAKPASASRMATMRARLSHDTTKFRTRSVTEGGVKGVRVWRIE